MLTFAKAANTANAFSIAHTYANFWGWLNWYQKEDSAAFVAALHCGID
jgi:hypothetical protein